MNQILAWNNSPGNWYAVKQITQTIPNQMFKLQFKWVGANSQYFLIHFLVKRFVQVQHPPYSPEPPPTSCVWHFLDYQTENYGDMLDVMVIVGNGISNLSSNLDEAVSICSSTIVESINLFVLSLAMWK